MADKRIKGFYYTTDKWIFKNGKYNKVDNNGCLFRDGIWRTKLKLSDLGEEFLKVYLYGRHNYMSTKGVTHVIYHPNYTFNHVYKDDSIYISYHGNILMKEKENKYKWRDIEGYDLILGGPDIVKVAEAIHKNSGLDMSEILKVMKEKPAWFDRTYPDGFNSVGEIDFTQHYYEAKKEISNS